MSSGNKNVITKNYIIIIVIIIIIIIIIISEVTVGSHDGGQVFLDKTKKVYIYEYRRPSKQRG
jgi:hypothetical protein